jgi:hypothetical protein
MVWVCLRGLIRRVLRWTRRTRVVAVRWVEEDGGFGRVERVG